MVKKESIYVRLQPQVVEKVDELKESGILGNSRSEVIRNIIIAHMTDSLGILNVEGEAE